INNKDRWTLWLYDVNPAEWRKIKPIYEAVERVREIRESSNRASTKKLAEVPYLFGEIRQPESDYLLIPSTSSENRRYIPIGFMTPDVIGSNLVLIVPDASLYHFGILTSNVHMAWMRTVAGRLGMSYRYSAKIVYNNFPWPEVTKEQKEKISQTAQAILDARALYPDSSLADLYDELTMPPELRKAHQTNDKAVMEAYDMTKIVDGKKTWLTESETVARLFQIYEELTKG
ncbi:type IIL restriction-modification enzyme MmeI, partial [Streptococcus alactolyticus]|uniref:type IIL restriction-modification enzyme MmeI n=1 Tax=Streptococcus alactolyticus TaxID=29389 RepID=UPI003F955A53